MKRTCLQAIVGMLTACVAVSCSTEPTDCGCNGEDTIAVSFTMNTPAGESVPYGASRAPQHDEAEWTIHKLSLYVYSVDGQSKGTFLRSYSTDASADEERISIVSNGAGTYNFTLRAPAVDLKTKQRFVFVANDAFAKPSTGEAQDKLSEKLATVTLSNNDPADNLAKSNAGIAMSGIAKSGSSDVVTITPGVRCEVKLKRIVARVDVKNNTPNLVIKSIEMQQAAPKGFLFEHTPIAAADETYITEKMNTTVALGDSYEAQKHLKKVFYLYERPNSDGKTAQIKITYTVNNSNGEVLIPFKSTGDSPAFVDITRNTLYTVVLGNGEPVTTNEVKFTLKVEDWSVVDMDESVDPSEDEQMKRNKALKVNMFTAFNAKEFNLDNKTITSFYDKLAVTKEDCPVESYVTWTELQEKGALTAEFTGPDGLKYRLPTEGELNLLLPMWTELGEREEIDPTNKYWGVYHLWWNDHESTNPKENPDTDNHVMATNVSTTGWTETIYLKNGSNGKPDATTDATGNDSEYRISGKSWMKLGALAETVAYPAEPGTSQYNIAPVYGLRFQGTSQCAAYRWESCKIASNPLERYFSIKIKALGKDDTQTTIDMVANEAFWKKGFIEFKFPASGFYTLEDATDPTSENITNRGIGGYCWSSSLWGEGDPQARHLSFNHQGANVGHSAGGQRFPLRFVKVSSGAATVDKSSVSGWGEQGTVSMNRQAQ